MKWSGAQEGRVSGFKNAGFQGQSAPSMDPIAVAAIAAPCIMQHSGVRWDKFFGMNSILFRGANRMLWAKAGSIEGEAYGCKRS
jgi:hypothetical protein